MNINDKNSITETVETEIAAIKQLRSDLIANDSFSEILNLLENTKGRIILTGMGKSGIIAKKISASLSSTGSPSYFLHPAEASHGDMGLITKDDITIAISNGGESKELADVINYCHRFAVPLIGITKNPNSTLGRNVDYILRLPDSPEAVLRHICSRPSRRCLRISHRSIISTGLLRNFPVWGVAIIR